MLPVLGSLAESENEIDSGVATLDRLGHLLGPAHAGALPTIFDEVLVRTLDWATGNRPAVQAPLEFVGVRSGGQSQRLIERMNARPIA